MSKAPEESAPENAAPSETADHRTTRQKTPRSNGPKRQRADLWLVERGLAATRQKAKALLMAGLVYRGEERVDKAGSWVRNDETLTVRDGGCPYVSRGGTKLEGALECFSALKVQGMVAADLGASTGGFSDCLLSRGVAKVFAVDVGYGQLHAKLRGDSRVVVMERTNARHLEVEHLGEAVDLVVIDASFIGLAKLLPAARRVLRENGHVVALIKPQFEVGRDKLGKHGVVRDEELRHATIDRVIAAACALGFHELGRCDCAIRGPKGNLEAFVWLRVCEAPSPMARA